MHIEKKTIRGSPHIGVFGVMTDKIGLLPKNIMKHELKGVEDLMAVEVVKTNLASSSLLGVLAVGNSKGFVVSEIAEPQEIRELEDAGVRVAQVEGVTALGNLLEINDENGVYSKILPEKVVKDVKSFLKVSLTKQDVAGTDIVGSCLVATNRGFIAHPNISEKEFKKLEKVFGTGGAPTTANYGDVFVGNAVLANSNAVLVGEYTSGHELIRIDEGLRGD